MSGAWIAASLLLPLALAALFALPLPLLRRALPPVAWVAPVPALLLALAGDMDARLALPWMLTGVAFGLDELGQIFLLLTALLWLASGLYAWILLKGKRGEARFHAFFLLAMAGNLGVILARDMAGFYLFFVLMSFAAYVLVIHDGSGEARRAGKVYLVLVVIGEALVVAGVLTAAAAAGPAFEGLPARLAAAPDLPLIAALLLVGYGIKAGVVPLHVWLPLAHPVAPTPASAVLSGAMIKTGLLAWLRFLPLGEAALATAGALCVAFGMLSAFYAAAVGVTQTKPKTVLAYSSVSQIGLMTVGVGVGLAAPELWPLLAYAVALFALHHGLAKGALFLGAGLVPHPAAPRWIVATGLGLAALSIAAAPYTPGMAAKALLKEAVDRSGEPWAALLLVLLPLAAVGTTLLMARFLVVVWSVARAPAGPAPLGALLAFVMLVVAAFALPAIEIARWPGAGADAKALWGALWPVLLGGVLGVAIGRIPGLAGSIPPGDLLVPLEKAAHRLAPVWRRLRDAAPFPLPSIETEHLAGLTRAWDHRIARWPVAGAVLMLLIAALALGWLAS